jgi:peptidylprolyl isomerase
VAQISKLADEGFYDGLLFHRVIDGFMAQGGCPNGTGMGGAKTKIKAEFNDTPHVEGVCSMARANDPNSASSQFFICLDDATFLDRQYTAWGRVVSGMEAVHAIKKGEPPRQPTRIKTFRTVAAE